MERQFQEKLFAMHGVNPFTSGAYTWSDTFGNISIKEQ